MALDLGTAFVDVQPRVGAGFFASLKSQFSGAAAVMSGIGAGLGVALTAGIAGGIALGAIGAKFDDAFDTIRTETGETGDTLALLGEDFKAVFAAVPTDMQPAAEAIALLHERTGLVGEDLQALATPLLELSRITETDLATNIEASTRLFGNWGVAVGDQVDTLDFLFRASQESGAGVDELAGMVAQFGAPLRQMGLGLEESIALFAKWEEEGVNSEKIMGGLRIGIGKMAEAGEDVPSAMAEVMDAIKNAGSDAEAAGIAIETFGARGGSELADAIRSGRFEMEDYLATIAGGEDTILGAARDTEDFGEKWKRFVNQALVALEPVATRVFDSLGKALDVIGPHLATFIDWIDQVVAAVSTYLAPVIETVRGFFDSLGGNMDDLGGKAQGFLAGWGEVWGHVQEVIASAQVFLSEVMEAIRKVWENHGEAILAFVKTVWDGIRSTIDGTLKIIKGIFDVFVAIFQGDWSKAWEGIKSILSGVWSIIKGIVTTSIEAVKLAIRLGLDFIGNIWQRAWDSLRSVAAVAWATFKTWLGNIWDRFTGYWAGLWDTLAGAVGAVFGGLVDTIRGVLNSIIGVLETGINAAIKGINGAIRGLNIVNPFADIPNVPEVHLPRLAQGGFSTSGGLALVGEAGPEVVDLPGGATVIPLDRMAGGTSRPILVTVVLEGREIARATGPYLADEIVVRSGVRRG